MPIFDAPSFAETQRLFSIENSLLDPVLGSIAVSPRFCRNSSGQFRLLSSDTLEGMQASDQNYRAVITTIDNSGPSGIAYIMSALPDDIPEDLVPLDRVLTAWSAQFPMERYAAAATEDHKQLQIGNHERLLAAVELFFDKCALKALPEDILQIPRLEEELADLEEERNEYPEDTGDLDQKNAAFDEEKASLLRRRQELQDQLNEEELTDEAIDQIDTELCTLGEELASIEESKVEVAELASDYRRILADIASKQIELDRIRAIRDGLDLEIIKSQAVINAQVGVALAVADHEPWSYLVICDQANPDCVLTEAQWSSLVSQAVDHLVSRDYVRLNHLSQGLLTQHLATRRQLQNEKRTNAEGNLRTQATETGDIHQLSDNEIRDPLDRKLYIDVAQSTDGSNFCDIVMGACLWAIENPPTEACPPLVLPESIQEFLSLRRESEPTYSDRSKALYQQFKANVLILPPEQMAILATYGVHPAPAAPMSPIPSAAEIGFLSSRKKPRIHGPDRARESDDHVMPASTAGASALRVG